MNFSFSSLIFGEKYLCHLSYSLTCLQGLLQSLGERHKESSKRHQYPSLSCPKQQPARTAESHHWDTSRLSCPSQSWSLTALDLCGPCKQSTTSQGQDRLEQTVPTPGCSETRPPLCMERKRAAFVE